MNGIPSTWHGALSAAALSATLVLPVALAADVEESHETSFTRYATINFADRKAVRHYYANAAALEAAKTGKSLPEGSVLVVEVYSTKLGSRDKPLMGCDGFLVADKLMGRQRFAFEQRTEVAQVE